MQGPKITLFYAARHGTTDLNQANSFRGNKDVSLDSSGIQDAHRLAYYFEPIEVCHIIGSDLKRASQTADVIGRKIEKKPILTPALHPWNVGMFSGKEKNKENMDKLDEFIKDPEKTIPGGESLNDFKRRVRPCLQEAIEVSDNNGVPLLLVVHSSVIHEIGDMFEGHNKAVLVKPGGVVEVYIQDGKIQAAPVFKGRIPPTNLKADTIS